MSLLTVAHEMKQHLEQVDEVQLQDQRTHHRQLGVGVVAVMFGVFFLGGFS
jgi:1,6-anhydro-N-acetylmuramate kinase